MEFTFGICFNGGKIDQIINSIRSLDIPNYQIIVVGMGDFKGDYITHIPYSDMNGNISQKKNIITQNAIYDNIVYLHDYIIFNSDWYEGFLKYGDDFNICMNKIYNTDGSRYRDWCLWLDDAKKYLNSKNFLIPYDMTNLSKMMYISGAYWVAKKKFMLENKLNEKLLWGQGEDVEWSIRSRKITDFKMNTYSSVKLLKYKDRIFGEANEKEIHILRGIKNYHNENDYVDLLNNHLSKWI